MAVTASPTRIGLTGGIGTGKSFVLRYLSRCGVPTLDTDLVARAVVEPGRPAFSAIVERFGRDVLSSDGTLDRSALARRVFADPAERRALEGIVHPAVWESVARWRDAHPGASVVAVPLLFETDRDGDFDRVMATDCAPDQQVARVVARDGVTAEAVRARLEAQLPRAERRRRASAVIDTGGTEAETIAQVRRIWEEWGLPALTDTP